MNRRKVLKAIPLLAGGIALSYGGLKWWSWNKSPDMDFLHRSQPLLSSVADTLFPKTNTPSASECGVVPFIIQLISECTDVRSQNRFIIGLKELESHAITNYKKSFSACSLNERLAMLNYFEKKDTVIEGKVGKAQSLLTGKPFCTTLKEYCIKGYFTSEGGATQALRYSHIPGAYVACEVYSPGEKAWATR